MERKIKKSTVNEKKGLLLSMFDRRDSNNISGANTVDRTHCLLVHFSFRFETL